MDPIARDFFCMPWPSDLRLNSDGTIDVTGFPGLDLFEFRVGFNLVESTAPYTFGFGVNSAVYFTFTDKLDPDSLPQPIESQDSNSPIMLVNLNPDSSEYLSQIPVKTEFYPDAATARPALLLAIAPYPGFVLEPASEHAVLLFNGLQDANGNPVVRAPLLDVIDRSLPQPFMMSDVTLQTLHEQKTKLDSYVREQTDWTPSDLVGFTYFTTQETGREMRGVSEALEAMMDTDLLDLVQDMKLVRPCECESDSCIPAAYDLVVDIPIWQESSTFDFILLPPQLRARGGNIPLDSDGSAQQQSCETVHARVYIPCTEVPGNGWPVLVYAGGSGADYTAGSFVWDTLYASAQQPLNHVVISIAPYITGEGRRDEETIAVLRNLMGMSESAAAGLLYFNGLNPLSGRNNRIQAAGEHLLLKRIMILFDQIATKFDVNPTTAGLSPGALQVNADRAVIAGHSQGANSSIPAMSIPGGFTGAYLNAAGALVGSVGIVHRGDVRLLIDSFLQLGDGEFDEFHPLANLEQTFLDASDNLTFVSEIETQDILLTNGYYDGCTNREAASALATALARYGRIQGGDNTVLGLPPIDGLETVLQQELLALPGGGNLPEGGTGVFLLLDGGHDRSGSEGVGGAFLYDIGNQSVPIVDPPPYGPSSFFECTQRIE